MIQSLVLPAAEEGEIADKVTVVLAAGSEGILWAGPVGVGRALAVAVEAETVPAVAAREAAVAPVMILGNWAGPVIQGVVGNLAAVGPDWEDPVAGHRETGPTGGLRLESMVAEIVGALEVGLAVAPGAVGACEAADKVVLPGCEEQKLVEDGAALGKMFGYLAVQEGAESMALAVDLDEDPGLADHSMGPDLENHILLVPAVHRSPSKQKKDIYLKYLKKINNP